MNTFGVDKLHEAITGEAIAPILFAAMQIAEDQARTEWPVETGASRDTIRREVFDVAPDMRGYRFKQVGNNLSMIPATSSISTMPHLLNLMARRRRIRGHSPVLLSRMRMILRKRSDRVWQL